jgi:imidazolonepropionase-like amidohydrolase
MDRARAGAKKRFLAVPVPDRNANKYFSYSEAWVRIKKAHGSGFFLEAVTLEESIIADRLMSFLVCVGEIQAESRAEKCSFGQLIQLWTRRTPQPIPVQYFPDLCSAVDEWRKHRNRVVHGMVKSMPGAQHGDVLDFLKEAEFVAFQGKALAHAVSDWVKKAKKRSTKTGEP